MHEFRGYPVTEAQIALAGRTLQLLVPSNSEKLIETAAVIERFAEDEYLPYWAQIWPASILLADSVATWGPASTDSPAVLEIGCGLGLVSLVLCGLGYRVLASDYDEDALAFVVENARRNGLAAPQTRWIDWREPYPELAVDRIVAADVLYETRHQRPVAEFIRRHLNPGGFALLADPNRMTADDFATVARHCGLLVETAPVESLPHLGDGPIQGRVYRLSR
jgi:2-polyprenyl-3-methyl-5-hydroxy-6-metoxy-1,4-benzoquinol methylase